MDKKLPNLEIKADTSSVHYSGNVKTIIDNKCYGCHCQTSKSEKARHKLNLDSLWLITKVAQISKLDKIIETLEKGDMPPRKYLERKPEARLTAEETKAITDWAKLTSDVLLK